jgi:hypothetical protein
MEVNTMFNSNCASVPLVASIDGGYGGNNGFLNGDGLWGLIIILALLGWGGNGFGFGGGFGGGRGSVEPCATQADVRAAVDQQTLISKLDNQTYGLADSTYALNNTITNGFHGVDNAICTLGYQTQSGFNALGHQISDCCCQTQRLIERGFADTNYNMATQACDTRHAIQDSTRQILDFLTTDKIASLQAENQALKFKASQAEQNAFITANQQAQTAELIRRLGADCPVNAYVVQPPTPVTFPVNCCGQFNGYGYGNSCGCGCA